MTHSLTISTSQFCNPAARSVSAFRCVFLTVGINAVLLRAVEANGVLS